MLPGPSLLWLDVQTLQPFAFLERLLYNSMTRVGRLLPGLSLLWLDVQALISLAAAGDLLHVSQVEWFSEFEYRSILVAFQWHGGL